MEYRRGRIKIDYRRAGRAWKILLNEAGQPVGAAKFCSALTAKASDTLTGAMNAALRRERNAVRHLLGDDGQPEDRNRVRRAMSLAVTEAGRTFLQSLKPSAVRKRTLPGRVGRSRFPASSF